LVNKFEKQLSPENCHVRYRKSEMTLKIRGTAYSLIDL